MTRRRGLGLPALRVLLSCLVLLASRSTAARGGTAATPPAALAQGVQPRHAPPRVLVLFSGSRLLPANVLFDESFRRALAASPGEPVECWGEFLDEAAFPAGSEERTSDLLRAKYGPRRPDVIVTFAAPAYDLCLHNRARLFPGVPIVFAGSGADTVGSRPTPGVTGVRSNFDRLATLRLALRLHPQTRQVYVISGPAGPDTAAVPDGTLPPASPSWGTEFRVPFHQLAGESAPQLLRTLSGLPVNSLVFDLSGFEASAGDMVPPEEALQRICEASAAPVYGRLDPLVERGPVGAVATPADAIGPAAAALVRRILSRGNVDSLPPVKNLAAVPLVDWRQLKRWHARTNLLPPGSMVRYEPRSFWRQYLLLVTTSGGLFLLQTVLILALVLQSRRRRRAELEARRRREELAHMTRVATMGELTASLAHEINQPLAAILSNAQAGQRLLHAGDANLDEIREILADIAADDQRAGEVIRRMRTLLRKGEFNPAELNVNDLVDEVVGLVRGEMLLQNVALTLDLSSRLRPVHGDRVQLQQVLLNLMMNALDAMKDGPGGNRRVVVRSSGSGAHAVEISVEDNGVGLPPDKLEQIFEPFVTTKAHGMGLGLPICRSIIQAHGGRIGARNNPGRGATVWFTLPAPEERKS